MPRTPEVPVRPVKYTKYIAVLIRAIPVDRHLTDMLAHPIEQGECVEDVMDWAERSCVGSTAMVSVQIVKRS